MDWMTRGTGYGRQGIPADFSSVMPYAEGSLRAVFRLCQVKALVYAEPGSVVLIDATNVDEFALLA